MTSSDLPAWLLWLGDHLGPIGGVVGMVTGVAGLLIARSAHRRATAIGRATSGLDARVEYDRAKREADRLEGLIAAALARGQGVASMRGALQSAEAARLVAEVVAIDAEIFAIDTSKFGSQTLEQFAVSLATIRQLQTRITAVAEKCRASIAASEHERDHAFNDQRAEMAARLSQPSPHFAFTSAERPTQPR